MPTDRSVITLSIRLTKHDAEMLKALCEVFGDTQTNITKRALYDMYRANCKRSVCEKCLESEIIVA